MCKICGQTSCDCEARIKAKTQELVIKCSTRLGMAMAQVARAELIRRERKQVIA